MRRLAPMRVRLPLAVAALLAVSTGAVVLFSYREVRRSVAASTLVRLRGSAQGFAAALAPGLRRSPADVQRIVGAPSVHAWLTGANDDAGARTYVDSLKRANVQNSAVALFRRTGERVLAGDSAVIDAKMPSLGVSHFFSRDDTVRYGVAVALTDRGDTLGRLVVVRSLNPRDTSSIALINSLVGGSAFFRFGNDDGSLWNDLTRATPAPIPDAAIASALAPKSPGIFGDTLGTVLRVPNTNWILYIGQPATVAMAAATSLARKLAVIAILAVLIGVLIVWWMIRRMTAPLDEMARASDALAHGNFQLRVAHEAPDELGRMATAFNTMADEITAQHRTLEGQVADRTADLERAVTDLRAAQEELVRNARLAMLGQLAGGVGHELRNPLGVMTNAVFVLETVLPDQGDLVKEYLGILKGQISLSEKIVADLLDFARTKPAQLETVRVDALVQHQIGRLGGVGNVNVVVDVPSSLPPAAIDVTQIGQVLFNLLTNAVQAMGEKGGTLRCKGAHDGNGKIELNVIDTGPGIPPDVAARIFEPLFTTKARGLGLGLTVSRMLAENNGGTLRFASTPGEGTIFTLTMPVAVPATVLT